MGGTAENMPILKQGRCDYRSSPVIVSSVSIRYTKMISQSRIPISRTSQFRLRLKGS